MSDHKFGLAIEVLLWLSLLSQALWPHQVKNQNDSGVFAIVKVKFSATFFVWSQYSELLAISENLERLLLLPRFFFFG